MKRHHSRLQLLTVLSSLALALAAASEVVELRPDDAATLIGAGEEAAEPFGFGDCFGDHVAAWKEWLFVSAPRERDTACNHADGGTCDGQEDGAVYVFRRDRHGLYILMQRLGPREVSPPTEGTAVPGAGDRFGAGLAVADGQLLAGVANFPADTADNDGLRWFAGAVEVFALDVRTNRWEWTGQTLRSPNPIADGSFGARTHASHISLHGHGRLAVIGEAVNRHEDPRPSAFYVFRRESGEPWRLVQAIPQPEDRRGVVLGFADKLIALDYGYYVASDLVATPGDKPNIVRLHLYGPDEKKSGGISATPLQTLEDETSLPASFGAFARDGLAYAEGRLVVADPLARVEGTFAAGAIRVYRFRPDARPRLALESIIPHPEPIDYGFGFGDFLGVNLGNGEDSVAYDGERLVVGTAAGDLNFFYSGIDVFLFERHGSRFQLAARLKSPTAPADFRAFGQSVTLIGNRILVGEWRSTTQGGHLLFYQVGR